MRKQQSSPPDIHDHEVRRPAILLIAEEVSHEFRTSKVSIYRLINEGVIPVVRLPHIRGVRIAYADLVYVATQFREER
jgi:hypothetical protein